MSDWELLNGTSQVFTLGGKYRPYGKTVDPVRWFWNIDMFRCVEDFKSLLMHESLNDFLQRDPNESTAYRISFQLEKLEGGYFEKDGGLND